MALPSRSRANLRLDVLKRLDALAVPLSSSLTSDSDSRTLLNDTILSPVAQVEDFIGDWIYIRSQPTKIDSTTNTNEAVDASETAIDVVDGTVFTVGDGIQIDDEIMRFVSAAVNTITVVRGIQGTTAATHSTATDIFLIGPAVGEIARVTDVTFSSTTSQLTISPAFSCSPVSGQAYERHRKAYPSVLNDRLDLILGLLRRNVFIPATLISDGDMQTSGVTSWTAATATLTKDTTAASIRHGAQSLKIVATAANGQARSANVNLPSDTLCIVAADVYITSGDSAKLTFYDVTNSAEIDTATAVGTGWVHLEFLATTPATCEIVQLRLESQANTDITFWDNAILWPVEDMEVELPSFLEQARDIQEIVYFPLGTGFSATGDSNAYRINEQSPQIWSHFDKQRDDTGAMPVRFYLKERSPEHPLWLVARKSYAAFAGATDALKDADTTVADRYVVANMTAASILDDSALEAIEREKKDLAAMLVAKADKLRADITDLAANMAPPKKKTVTSPFTRGIS